MKMIKLNRLSALTGIGTLGVVTLYCIVGRIWGMSLDGVVLLAACLLTMNLLVSTLATGVIMLLILALVIGLFWKWKMIILPVAMAAMISARFIIMSRKRYSSVRPLFQNGAVWEGLMDMSDAALMLLLDDVFVILLSSSLSGFFAGYVIAAVMTAALYGIAIVRRLKDRSFLTSPGNEEEIRTIARGCLRPHEFDPDTSDRKMTALYRKAVSIMEEKQLFLDENLDLESFSRKMLSNKSYLSKTINVMSGRNFRQFVNYYRVEYAVNLLMKDPVLKMEEVALMSGFHTVVSFNMAFRLFRGETPSDWLREVRARD